MASMSEIALKTGDMQRVKIFWESKILEPCNTQNKMHTHPEVTQVTPTVTLDL